MDKTRRGHHAQLSHCRLDSWLGVPQRSGRFSVSLIASPRLTGWPLLQADRGLAGLCCSSWGGRWRRSQFQSWTLPATASQLRPSVCIAVSPPATPRWLSCSTACATLQNPLRSLLAVAQGTQHPVSLQLSLPTGYTQSPVWRGMWQTG